MRQFPAVVAPSLGVWKKNQSVQDPPINALSLNLGAGGGGASLGCLGPADTPGLIGVLTSSSMDPMSPLGLLILSILNNLDSVNSFGPTVTMAITTTSTPPTVRLPFFHMAPDVRPLCYLYTFLCLSYHESPLCCPHWTFATTLS